MQFQTHYTKRSKYIPLHQVYDILSHLTRIKYACAYDYYHKGDNNKKNQFQYNFAFVLKKKRNNKLSL